MSREPSPHVLPVNRSDSGRVGGVLGRAFHDTDQWASLMPDPRVRQRKLEQMFGGTVKLVYAADGLVERTAGFEAVAMWLPPGRDIGMWQVVKSGFASARFAVTPPFQNILRMTSTLRQFDICRRKLMPEPHWYLMTLGVDPSHQRGGFGSALVRHGIQRANDDNKLIYLETETDANATFYEKLGFEAIDEIVIEAIDVRFSLMTRQPDVSDT